MREDNDQIVGRGVLEQARSSRLNVSPVFGIIPFSVQENQRSAGLTTFASVRNVDVTLMVHLGVWISVRERCLVEGMQVTEIMHIKMIFIIYGKIAIHGLQHVVSRIPLACDVVRHIHFDWPVDTLGH